MVEAEGRSSGAGRGNKLHAARIERERERERERVGAAAAKGREGGRKEEKGRARRRLVVRKDYCRKSSNEVCQIDRLDGIFENLMN